MQDANLQNADLQGANLQETYLQCAEVENTGIVTFQYNKHFAFCHEGNIQIGCIYMSIEEWMGSACEIGLKNDFTEIEINAYMSFIRLCKQLEGKS